MSECFHVKFSFSGFLHFCDYLRFEEGLALYLNKLEFSSPKDNLYQVWLILSCWFWRRFLKIFSVFLLFRYYLPLEKGYPLPLNKLESPSPKDNLCQVWLNLVYWFWRRFLNDPTYTLALNKLESPSPKDDLCQVWLKLVQWFWRRSQKCKSLQTDRQQVIKKAHLS
jgi:hypothetical protein